MHLEVLIQIPGATDTAPALAPNLYPSDRTMIGKDLVTGFATLTVAPFGGFSGIATFVNTWETYAAVQARLAGADPATDSVAVVSGGDLTTATAAQASWTAPVD